jgi:glycosyltransferase involved in cell wall biosynthesis
MHGVEPGSAGRLAFVTPRYGTGVVGGSEAVMREAAAGLADRGWSVDVLTTCARDHYTWENVEAPGVAADGAVAVHRFPVERRGSRAAERLERRIQRGEALTLDEQARWLDGRLRVPALLHHLVVHADDYDAIVLSPYLFWTTVVGASVAPERSIVMPCLHDEPYARLELLQRVLSGSAGLWFLSEPEHELAHRLADLPELHAVTGAGVGVPDGYDADGFRSRHGLTRPFVLFAGRREHGKGWAWLLDAYQQAVATASLPLDLVTIGVGAASVPPAVADRVHDLGLLDAGEVPHAFAAAAAYVQPSPNESFSRTIMEAWLAGTLVLATDRSEVLRWHCERSGAGITFHDAFDLTAGLSFLAARPEVAARIAAGGRGYVLEHYDWPVVLDAMEENIRSIACRP